MLRTRLRALRLRPSWMSLSTLGAVALAVGLVAATAPAARADGCNFDQYLSEMNPCSVWHATRGANATIDVLGDLNGGVTKAQQAAEGLAPSADVHPEPNSASAGGVQSVSAMLQPGIDVVDLSDTSIDLSDPGIADSVRTLVSSNEIVVAAAGGKGQPIPGVLYVAAVDTAGHTQAGSAAGPRIGLSAYAPDTATATGYVAASAALVRSQHREWTPRQVIALLAATAHQLGGDVAYTQEAGFGLVNPLNAVNSAVPDFAALQKQGFDTLFPDPAAASPGTSATGPGASAGEPVSAGQPVTATTTGGKGSGGGPNPLLLIAFALMAAAAGAVLWKRRQQPEPAQLRPRDEWGPPTGPRHSGYGGPPED